MSDPNAVVEPVPVSTTARQMGRAAGYFPRWFRLALCVLILLLVGLVVVRIGLSVVNSAATVASHGIEAARASVPKPLPVLPITVTMRKAMMGEGYVLKFFNDGEKTLKFDITHERTSLNQRSAFSMLLQAGASQEVGWQEGHVFYPGDSVLLAHSEFQPKRWVLNPD